MENKLRVGLGYDIHRLEENRDLIIGGEKIPYEKGLFGHSDADVLVHAIIDAILGAISLPDIGTLFPDTSDEFAGANSLELLANVVSMMKQKEYKICNIDTNIIAERPKMMKYIPNMKRNLSNVIGISEDYISIKAKTKEHLDSIGQNLAIEAQAVVLVEKIS